MGNDRKVDKKEFEGTIKLFIGDDDIVDADELANVLQIADKQHIATTNVNKSLATKIRKYKISSKSFIK